MDTSQGMIVRKGSQQPQLPGWIFLSSLPANTNHNALAATPEGSYHPGYWSSRRSRILICFDPKLGL